MILSPDQVVMALLEASRELGVTLTRDEMVGLTEIPSRESGYDSGAFHDSAARGDGTGDLSYGLWQINMLGGMGTARAQALGLAPTRAGYEALKDPVTNAKAAIQLVLAGRKQGDPLHAWGGYKGMSNTYNVSSSAAQAASAAVDRVGTGATGGNLLQTLRSNIYTGQGNSPAGNQLVSWLKDQIGKPYVFGSGINPDGSGFDCSSLVASAYKSLGIDIPAYTFSMKNYGVQVTDYKNLQPGDMLYAHGAQGDFGHVGIYIGGDTVIDAPHTGAFVREQPLSAWLPRIQSVNRIMDADGNVIVGGGQVAGHRAGIGQVTASQAKSIADPNTAPPLIDPNAVPGAAQPTLPKIIEDRQPFILPGFGKDLVNV